MFHATKLDLTGFGKKYFTFFLTASKLSLKRERDKNFFDLKTERRRQAKRLDTLGHGF